MLARALWEERKTNQCQGTVHRSPTMKMERFPAPSCSPAGSLPSGFCATRGSSRHLCSATECSRARDTLSYWASPAIWELYGPHCHQAEWAVMCPFFLTGSWWQGGLKLKFLSRPEPSPGLGGATPGRLPGLHLLGLPVGPRGWVLMPLLPKLLLQPLLFLLQVSGHVVKGGLVQAAKALVHAGSACAGGTRVDDALTPLGAVTQDIMGRRL